jgi:flagellar biogenesis protein FliO
VIEGESPIRAGRRHRTDVRRHSRPATLLAACALSVAGAAAAPRPAAAQPARQSTTRPAPVAIGPAPARGAAPATAPASQPYSPARTAAGLVPLRREVSQTQPARAATTKASAEPPAAPGFDLGRVAGALAIVLGLIFALRWLMGRTLQPGRMVGATGAVQVLSRSPLSPRQHLLLLRVGRRLIVAADCNGQLSSLSEITDPDEVAALVGQVRDEKLTSASKCFGNMLGRWKRPSDDSGEDEGEDFPRVPPDVYDAPARRRDDADGRGDGDDDASVAGARNEMSNLMERVRSLSQQFKKS